MDYFMECADCASKPGSPTLCAACLHNRATIATLRDRLPEGMKDCTIIFRECAFGHGWLTAKNWSPFPCPACALNAEKARADMAVFASTGFKNAPDAPDRRWAAGVEYCGFCGADRDAHPTPTCSGWRTAATADEKRVSALRHALHGARTMCPADTGCAICDNIRRLLSVVVRQR